MSKLSSLSDKYAGFAVPAYKITAGGAELKYTEYLITEISVDNSIGETAGGARFTLTQVYEPGSRKLDTNALSKLKPGTKVSVSLGYGSDVTEVFTGYIDELKMRSDSDGVFLTALCLDARGLMRGGSGYAAVKDKKLQDVVSALLDKYSALVTSKDVKLSPWEQEVNITQAGSDLEFITQAAYSRGALFYIDCGKAKIGAAENTVCLELDWGQFDMDFTVRYLDGKVTAHGSDIKKMESYKAEAEAKQTANQEQLVTVGSVIRAPHYMDKDSAKAHVDALAARKVSEAVFGTLYCVGVPEVKLGQKVKINKFPMADAGAGSSLTVVSVSHSLSTDDGFSTSIGVEG